MPIESEGSVTAMTETKPGECRIVTVERQLTAVAKAQVWISEIPTAQRTLRSKIDAAVRSLDVEPLGHTFTLWRPLADGRLYLEPGVLVSRVFEPVGEVVSSVLPGWPRRAVPARGTLRRAARRLADPVRLVRRGGAEARQHQLGNLWGLERRSREAGDLDPRAIGMSGRRAPRPLP